MHFSATTAVLVFVVCLAVSVVSSVVFARKLDRAAHRFGLSEGLLGFLLAAGGNLPEASTAVTALLAGSFQAGVGVVLGSNVYNLAALLAGAALLAAPLPVHRETLVFNGIVTLSLTGLAAALVYGWLSAWLVLLLALVLILPYLLVLALRPQDIEHRLQPSRLRTRLEALADYTDEEGELSEHVAAEGPEDYLALVPTLFAIICSSIGLVYSADYLGGRLGVSDAVVGTLVLASVTGLPNLIGALRLARHGRGRAVISESLNSNNSNLLIGLFIPAVILGLGPITHTETSSVIWLLALTGLTLVLAGRKGRFSRPEALIVIGVYLAFAVVTALR